MSMFPNVQQDPAPLRDDETGFEHLSRRAGPDWDRVRKLIDEWCDNLDLAEWKGTVRHLESGGEKFRSAFWELYLGAVFRRLGFKVEYQPRVDVTPDKWITPDFRLCRGPATVFVEATSIDEVREILGARRHLGGLLKSIREDDRIATSSFFLNYDPIRTSPQTPPLRSLCDQIAEWLTRLDPASAHRNWLPSHEKCDDNQGCFEWREPGWHIRFFAFARRPEARGVQLDWVIGRPNPGTPWRRRDALDIKEALERKEKKYGRDCQPCVLAVMSPRFTNWHEIASALFGIAWEHPAMIRNQRIEPGWAGDPAAGKRREVSGFWLDQNGPKHLNVAAVITAVGLHPYTTANVEPDLWLNPWADQPLGKLFPFRTHRVDPATGAFFSSAEPEQSTRSILGLWEGWPKVAAKELTTGQAT